MIALRLLGLRGTVAVLAIAAALAFAVRVDWLTADRDVARAEAVEAARVSEALSASLASARADLRTVAAAVFAERDRAVAAEKAASAFREGIARDAGTDRDAPTAPVLLDTLRRLGKPSG